MNKLTAVSAVLIGSMLVPVLASAKKDSRKHQKINKQEVRSHSCELNEERLMVGRALIEVTADIWPSVMPYYTDDIEYHDPIVDVYGKEVMTQFLARLFTSSADLITTVEDETCIDGKYMSAWTMVGSFNGVPYSAKGMSIIKFRPGTSDVYYQRDYYTEGDIMVNIPGLAEPTEAFRAYYKCAVDPAFDCPIEE